MAKLNAAIRDDSRKSVAKQLRKQGKIPAVVYGKTVGNQSVAVNEGEMSKLFRQEGRNALIELNLDDNKEYTVMAHELQYDHIKGTIQHIDFLEVNVNEEIDAVVPVVLQGAEAAEEGGAVLNHTLNELTVRALPTQLPNAIEIDVSGLNIGDHVRIGDIKPDGQYTILGDPEEVVVSVFHHSDSVSEAPSEEAKERNCTCCRRRSE
ncbi:50S ribosomal protein L25/general stress protein Ctc [Terrilactibacillus sp. S3-3]|nr:50S ribosomal protein L25/general stress protein Ctc [Terrilactibacillus sp. S3-3]